MVQWAALTLREREARLNFAETKKLTAEQLAASWAAYQELSPKKGPAWPPPLQNPPVLPWLLPRCERQNHGRADYPPHPVSAEASPWSNRSWTPTPCFPRS